MKQYNAIKAKYPDALLLFRVGDFYETFGEDAVRAAKILASSLPHRNNGGERYRIGRFSTSFIKYLFTKIGKSRLPRCYL